MPHRRAQTAWGRVMRGLRAALPLESLAPRWLGEEPRVGVGLTFRCPGHIAPHWLTVFFENPVDGGPPEKAPRYFWRQGEELEQLTVVGGGQRGHGELVFPGHWAGWLIEGELWPADPP